MWKRIRDGEIPEINVPLILSDGKSIYAGFYGESFFKTKFHAWGTNAHIKYWMLAPDLPNSENVELAATDSQQLKAEIAAFVHTVVANQGECLQQNVDNFIERMRQLSAV